MSNQISEVAAFAAEAVDTTANTVKAVSLYEVALSKDRKEQCKLFGRHFSSTEKAEVVKNGAINFLKEVDNWKANLEALLQEIEQKEAANRMEAVLKGADSLSEDELQKMIEALQAKVQKAG